MDKEVRTCIIKTNEGSVRGYIAKKEDKTIYHFKKIPYARPPVGPLRFLPPLPAIPWTEVLDCTQDAPIPMTFGFEYEILGSEDCLFIEIATPDINPQKPLPVMFWVGCYCFTYCCDQFYDCSTLVEEDVVFVRCGFRLGPFGFLSINNMTAPGNCGLKDVVLALKWVQRNIAAFGGDPTNVTLFGNSTGGATVHLMMLSPMATGLFHKCIIQSASSLNNWCIDKNPTQITMQFAKAMGLSSTCYVEVLEALKASPAEEIMKTMLTIKEHNFSYNDAAMLEAIFKPCIEQDFEGQPAFLTKSPILIIKSGNFNKVPMIIGSNNAEAAILQFIKHDFYEDYEKYNENLHLLVPKYLKIEGRMSKLIGQKLLKFYLDGEENLTKDTMTPYVQLISDYYFLYYIQKTVKLHIECTPQCPIYYYILHQNGEWFIPKEMQCFNSAGHGAEVPFIFGLKAKNISGILKGSRDSVKTRKRVSKMWTNFAKYGNPTPDEDDQLLQIKWDPVENESRLNYLSIGPDLCKGRNPFQDRMQFWEELHREYTFLRALVYFNDIGITW